MDLFEHASTADLGRRPFADAVRPDQLDGFFGQSTVVAPQGLLGQAMENDRVGNLVLWGPPGSGKTTFAHLIAYRSRRHFIPFSALFGGVKEIRKLVEAAKERRALYGQDTLLFIDEIHRFNKGQQDALLPHMETGTFSLVGATTENPSFQLNGALLSRCRVVVFEALSPEELERVLRRAWAHPVRAQRWPDAMMEDGVYPRLAAVSGGDARRALNLLEACLDLEAKLTVDVVSNALESAPLLYDRAGDEHYQCASAFIKSMRLSDPDASVYWLQRMLDGGEDPEFCLRRMVIFASEDIGLADPGALQVALNAGEAYRNIGMPEGFYPLMNAALYLACAPKSDGVKRALAASKDAVRRHGSLPVPLKLRNASTEMAKALGYGRDYRDPHRGEDHFIAESGLPDALKGQRFYHPTDQGFEATIKVRVEAWHQRRSNPDAEFEP